MSDITGPQAPRDIQTANRGPDKTAPVQRDPGDAQNAPQTVRQAPPSTPSAPGETYAVRDPAVSIAASTAHLRKGQLLEGSINRIDAEGRPIITADKVTIALRPDAGLKPSDSVALRIIDTGKELTAELVTRNGQPEQPPTKVALTIIALKGEAVPAEAERAAPRSPLPNTPTGALPTGGTQTNTSYAPPQAQTSSVALGASSGLTSGQSTQNAGAGLQQSSVVPNANPALSSSKQGALLQPSALSGQSGTANTAPQGLPPQSTTGVGAVAAAAPQPSGLGPAITAASLDGRIVKLEAVDVAVSRVPPRELALVQNETPLNANEVRTLNLPPALLGAAQSPSGAADLSLVKLQTTQGTFIAGGANTSHLTGETVRITQAPETAQATAATGGSNVAATQVPSRFTGDRYTALWVAGAQGSLPTKADIQFVPGNSGAVAGTFVAQATVTSVQTVAAFLSATGPRADIRLQTTAGDISLTIPAAQRPQVGDGVRILNTAGLIPDAAKTAQTVPSALASGAAAAQAGTPVPAGETGASLLANWPAYEDAVAALSVANPEAAHDLTHRSAQGGGRLTNSLLFFLAAAGRGGPDAWIGEKATLALEAVARNSLERLQSDLRQMVRLPAEATGEWRPIVLPFDARLGDFPLITLLLPNPERHQDGADPDGKKQQNQDTDDQRFIVQVEFSVLGDIQLDGRIHEKRFDLTVRSKEDFSGTLTQDARLLFEEALAANGYQGAIRFETTPKFSINAADIVAAELTGA